MARLVSVGLKRFPSLSSLHVSSRDPASLYDGIKPLDPGHKHAGKTNIKKSDIVFFQIFLLLSLMFFSSCLPKRFARGAGDPEAGVDITWRGHSCFLLEDSAGRRLLIDPFDETVGYVLARDKPTAVLVSHDHFDHNFLPRDGSFDVVKTSGTHTVDGIEVTALLARHDAADGAVHGNTLFFIFSMGGLTFAHLGDVGQKELTPAQLDALKNVDVLFIPVGGQTTIDGKTAAGFVRRLNPRIVFPMHYGNDRVRFYQFDPPEPFLKLFENVQFSPLSQAKIRRAALPVGTVIYVPALP
jgi:L-ascorbate metabolism protein UlaG (beta-lactamase superfamily)